MAEDAPMKTCTKCGQKKSSIEFSRDRQKRNGLASACKQCAKKRGREYYATHRESVLKRSRINYSQNRERKNKKQKEWGIKNRDHRWRQSLKYKFSITSEEWLRIFNEQNGCCAICGVSQNNFKKRFHTDHDHVNNRIRGLLCVKCNTGLGSFEDDPIRLQNAISYLKEN